MKNKKLLAPSLLAADFTRIYEGIESINKSGADLLHLDVMDGSFVPEITFGTQMVRQVKPLTTLPLDVHLMIDNPQKHIEGFAEAGADYITVHYENSVHLHRYIQKIKDLGCKAGVALVPSTPPQLLSEIAEYVDLILIMTVNPGHGGQKLIESCLRKVDFLTQLRVEKGYNYLISIDGGVSMDTLGKINDTCVDVCVAGSAFFKADDKSQFVKDLKE